MGLSVSAAAVDINEPYKVAKKEKALSGDTFHVRPSSSEGPPLHATRAYTSKGSGSRFCFMCSTPFQKKACMVIHATGYQEELGVRHSQSWV